MKEKIHPQFNEIKITCACGNVIKTSSTLSKDFSVEICSACHPFFTGKHKIVDSAGKVEKFNRRYGEAAKLRSKKALKKEAMPAAKQ